MKRTRIGGEDAADFPHTRGSRRQFEDRHPVVATIGSIATVAALS